MERRTEPHFTAQLYVMVYRYLESAQKTVVAKQNALTESGAFFIAFAAYF